MAFMEKIFWDPRMTSDETENYSCCYNTKYSLWRAGIIAQTTFFQQEIKLLRSQGCQVRKKLPTTPANIHGKNNETSYA